VDRLGQLAGQMTLRIKRQHIPSFHLTAPIGCLYFLQAMPDLHYRRRSRL